MKGKKGKSNKLGEIKKGFLGKLVIHKEGNQKLFHLQTYLDLLGQIACNCPPFRECAGSSCRDALMELSYLLIIFQALLTD